MEKHLKIITLVLALTLLILSSDARSQDTDPHAEIRFRTIELESYYKAYGAACDHLRVVEEELALTGETSEEFEQLLERQGKLQGHLKNLRVKADAICEAIDQMTKAQGQSSAAPAHAPRKVLLRNRLEETGRSLDVGIDGKGYFRVFDLETNETLFSRIGHFDINKDGLLILKASNRKLHIRPNITIPEEATDIVIAPNGSVRVRLAGNVELQQCGQIELATFGSPEKLLECDDALFTQTIHSGEPTIGNPGRDGAGLLRQSTLEVSDSQRLRDLVIQLELLLSGR